MIMILLMEIHNLVMLVLTNTDLLINAGLLQDTIRIVLGTTKNISSRASLRVQCEFPLRGDRFKMISCFQGRSRREATLLLAAAGGDRIFTSTLFDDVLL